MEMWEPKPPGTLWATPGLLWDCFTFTFYQLLYIYTVPPDDGLQICPKLVEVDLRNKLRITTASNSFSLPEEGICVSYVLWRRVVW